eukprot:TRINITY_DN806_c3_g1_i1.p1 TRINITY_DN806_c3_g1~~TRINITY_DN806_c3_g1_i1.p1  ORF type:complete len:768 (+),score=263.32 TRINITY_DN806_c3_g1_i1:84-2387(+)
MGKGRGKGRGKGAGCCSSDNNKFATFAGDSDTDHEGEKGMLTKRGWPPRIRIDKQGRCKGFISDLPMCLIFIVFWIILVVFATIGFDKGDPRRLLYGTDYQGKLCGHDSEPEGWASNISACKAAGKCAFQSAVWEENKFLWYPLPYDGQLENGASVGDYSTSYGEFSDSVGGFDPGASLASGICVRECPQFSFGVGLQGSITVEQLQQWFTNPQTLRDSLIQLSTVYTYGPKGVNSDGTLDKAPTAPFFYVWYNSNDTLRRCVPKDSVVDLLSAVQDKIPSLDFVGDFWNRALQDIENAWRIFVICGVSALVLCCLYTILLRCCLKPFILLCIIVTLVVLIACGYLCYTRYKRLNDNTDPDDDDDAKAWLGGAAVFWCLALAFFLVMCCLRKQILTACEIIIQAGKVIRSDITMLLVPILTAISVCALLVFILVVALYIYTIEEDGSLLQINNTYASGASSFTNVTIIEEQITVRNMLYYVFFGWLWTMGVLNAIGFFVIASCCVQWYYSYRDDDRKKLRMVRCWLRGYFWSFQMLGGLITGAFLVALVQFTRFIVEQFSTQIEKHFGDKMGKCIRCLIQCCLAYLERVLKYITKNAYVIMAVQGSGFWCACCDLMTILMDNVGLFAAIAVISDAVFFVGKLLLTAGNCMIAYAMLDNEDLAPDVQNGIIIIIIVGLGTYVIACLFMHVYSTCIDAMVILVARELRMGEAADTIACPGGVFKIVTGKTKDDQKDLDDWRATNKAQCDERKAQKGASQVKVSAAPGEA